VFGLAIRGYPAETHLVGILERPAIKAIVARVEAAFREPGDVAVLEVASTDSREGAVPVEQIGGSLYESESESVIFHR
jgi:hypothetical protein